MSEKENSEPVTNQSKWQIEFAGLPAWAQSLVRAITANGLSLHGYGMEDRIFGHLPVGGRGFFIGLANDERMDHWIAGFSGLRELAAALSALYPPPSDLQPHDEMTTGNVVEMIAGPDDCAFDQPCYFGYRVESHAVYCHNEAWPDSPRKCRRNRTDYRHEDCPGFVSLGTARPGARRNQGNS